MVAACNIKSTLRPPADYAYAFESARPAPPWMTAVLLAIIMAVFAIETLPAFPTEGMIAAPNMTTLVAMGGLSRALLMQGEAYRMIAAPFLHENLLHLVVNVAVLGAAGTVLERLAGSAWTFFIFALGGLAGSTTSLILLPAAAISVGAAGAIMAVLVAWMIIVCRISDRARKLRHQAGGFALLALQLLPLDDGVATSQIHLAAELGGGLIGGLLGLLLLLTWPADSKLPAMRTVAAILSGVAGLSLISTAYAVTAHYPLYIGLGGLMPPARYLQNAGDQRVRAPQLLSLYPRDPRAHIVAAEADLQGRDRQRAEYELRVAMTLANEQTALLFPALDNTIHAMLAITLLEQGKKADALSAARPSCQVGTATAPPAELTTQLVKAGLCAASSR